MTRPTADHPHTDPGDGRTECETCGKFVWLVIHSCKRIPVTAAARARWNANQRKPDDTQPHDAYAQTETATEGGHGDGQGKQRPT